MKWCLASATYGTPGNLYQRCRSQFLAIKALLLKTGTNSERALPWGELGGVGGEKEWIQGHLSIAAWTLEACEHRDLDVPIDSM